MLVTGKVERQICVRLSLGDGGERSVYGCWKSRLMVLVDSWRSVVSLQVASSLRREDRPFTCMNLVLRRAGRRRSCGRRPAWRLPNAGCRCAASQSLEPQIARTVCFQPMASEVLRRLPPWSFTCRHPPILLSRSFSAHALLPSHPGLSSCSNSISTPPAGCCADVFK